MAVESRVCLIASDILILYTTWIKTYTIKRAATRSGIKTPLATILLKDGTAYFIMLLSLNITNIVGFSTGLFVYAGYFTTPLSSIVISHFLINLRQLAHVGTKDEIPSFVHSLSSRGRPSIRFASFVDNMGEQLEYRRDKGEEDDPDTSRGRNACDRGASTVDDFDPENPFCLGERNSPLRPLSIILFVERDNLDVCHQHISSRMYPTQTGCISDIRD
ncbi:hypothetical protein OBBRIDRAFT_331487 [Obba rivulosa]|uniref:Uncharacterized protein n=1 Tax=Obba rivulosa TaxID=1052685 RepID=A0A8E2DJX2_9APHY|nr:hypothetical protein OBBRIDRAFT_331487 [Obba rivulosa]